MTPPKRAVCDQPLRRFLITAMERDQKRDGPSAPKKQPARAQNEARLGPPGAPENAPKNVNEIGSKTEPLDLKEKTQTAEAIDQAYGAKASGAVVQNDGDHFNIRLKPCLGVDHSDRQALSDCQLAWLITCATSALHCGGGEA